MDSLVNGKLKKYIFFYKKFIFYKIYIINYLIIYKYKIK